MPTGVYKRASGTTAKALRARWPLSLEERLYARTEFEPNTGCWLWSGPDDRRGYGRIDASVIDEPKNSKTHRLSWVINRGPIPPGLFVLHKCDTPACWNPDHLFLGTQKDNMADCSAKRRTPRGERQGASRFKNADILEIRRMCAEGLAQSEVAERFHTSQAYVSEIVNRRKWAHI